MAEPKEYTAGVSIETNHGEGAGTLGCFARDAGGMPVLLSCSHVLFPGFAVIDDLRVYQPDYSTCCSGGDPIARPVFDRDQAATEEVEGGWVGGYHEGTWTGGFNSIPARIRGHMGASVPGHASELDCAIATLDPGIRFRNVWRFRENDEVIEVPLEGAVTDGFGIGRGPLQGEPSDEQYVRVFSITANRVIYGTLLPTPPDIEHADDPDHIIFRYGLSDPSDASMGIKTSVNQFLILPRPTPRPGQSYRDGYRAGERLSFDRGDSGSIVINHENRIVAMVIRMRQIGDLAAFDRNVMEFADVGSLAIATPIQKVLEHLQITIPEADGGWSGTVPSRAAARIFVPGMPVDPELVLQHRGLDRLRQGMRASRRGRLLLGKIERHRREVRDLFLRVRAISSAWRELNGAGFYHHCVQSVRDPDHVIPTSINGVTREQLVGTMLPLFARHGSAALRRDIERYRRWAAATLLHVTSLEDVPAAVARRWPPS